MQPATQHPPLVQAEEEEKKEEETKTTQQAGRQGLPLSALKKTSSYLDILQQKFYDAFMDTFS